MARAGLLDRGLALGWGFPQAGRVLPVQLCLMTFAALLGAAAEAPAVRWAETPEPVRVAFQFASAAPLFARPGLGRDGSLYVGSGDGYVHALAADGRFRWSYTVKGRVVAPPVEDPSTGRVFVATSGARLYALEADSHLRWVFPLPVAPKSELALSPQGTLLFVGQDDFLYGVTTGGALSLRLAARKARSAPVPRPNGQTALVLGDALAILKGYGYDRVALAGPFTFAAQLAIDAESTVYYCEAGRAGAARSGLVELDRVSDCLSPPVRGDGFFAVAQANGSVRLLAADGSTYDIPSGGAPLRPVWDGPRRRLVVSTAQGRVRVLDLSGGLP